MKSAVRFKCLRRCHFFASLYICVESRLLPRTLILLNCQGVSILVNSNDAVVARALISAGVWEPHQTRVFSKSIKPNMTIVDVGANFGYYSLIAAKVLNGTGRIIAFEPVPRNYELFVKSIKQNQFKNIIAVRRAISNTIGTQKLYLDEENYGICSFSEETAHHYGHPVTVETVETTTLDSYLNRLSVENVDILKVDAEGAEPLVFEGSERTLRRTRMIFMEFWPQAVRNLHRDPRTLLKELNNSFAISRIDEAADQLIKVSSDEELSNLAGIDHAVNLLLEAE